MNVPGGLLAIDLGFTGWARFGALVMLIASEVWLLLSVTRALFGSVGMSNGCFCEVPIQNNLQ